jgi:hypothetical protein
MANPFNTERKHTKNMKKVKKNQNNNEDRIDLERDAYDIINLYL